MRQVVDHNGVVIFHGSVENGEDLRAASSLAAHCAAYSIDDDDEDYCDRARTCFNCRYRRWLADGFECAKGLMSPEA